MKPQIRTYPRKLFFKEGFPFSIQHKINRTEEFNEQTRFQREFWKITYILDGKGTMILNDSEFPIHSKSVYIVHPGALTTYRMESDALELYNIVFDPLMIEHELTELKDDFHFFAIFSDSFLQSEHASLYIQEAESGIETLIKSMEREFEYKRSNYQALLKWKLMELLILLLRKGEQKIKSRNPQQIVEYVDNILTKYYYEEIQPAKLANNIGITVNHLCRLYKKQTSKTISEQLRQIRLNHVAEALKNSSLSITEIAFKSGYNDLSYFYRAFNKFYDCNPREYRKNIGLD
ncbi:MAG: AraC family transcriptional regulator [Victivallales bacterium]|jgi:AraC-like DNA-binding protein|nr:AraC family transcriptional regulator [Victivallales bacterium]